MSLIGLGRLHAPDPDDHKYKMADHRQAAAGVTHRYWSSPDPAYDQGGTSQCVAFAGVRYLTTGPIRNKPIPFQPFYTELQRNDEWPGEEPDYEGTSVRAMFKVLKRDGYVSDYTWAWSVEPVIAHLLAKGPVVVGTDWTMSMFTPDRWNFITPDGEAVGGHGWCLIGANRDKLHPLTGERGAVRMINSWGTGWADHGRAWISFSHLDKLIKANGEAGVSTEVKKVT